MIDNTIVEVHSFCEIKKEIIIIWKIYYTSKLSIHL